MADILRIKRRVSGSPGAPASLANAEIAYNETDHTLYYGEGTGGAGGTATVVVPIAGPGMASGAAPAQVGTAAPGTATQWARGDHVHPATAPTPANGTNSTAIATTQFVLATRLDQLAAPAGPVAFNSQRITGVANPSNPQDACTKNYADTVAQGLDAKPSVRAASVGNLTLSAAQVVDGTTLVVGDRVLVKDQTTQSANGIYIVASGAWTRATDVDTWNELISAFVFVESGTANADTAWLCTVDPGGTLETTNVTWVQFASAGQIQAGNGLTKTGNTIDVVGSAGRIIAYADQLDIDPAYFGQTSITTLGSVTTGTWNASTVQVNRGGTGATTLTGYVLASGTSPFTASATIPSTAITGLGTMSTQNATAVAITGGTIDGVTFDCGTF